MDEPNARLFGFVRTDAEGRFTIETVHPGPNPEANWSTGDANLIPRHLHFVVSAEGHAERALQMVFSDDPRLTSYWREWARKGNHEVVEVQRDDRGDQQGRRVSLDITLDAS